MNSTNIIICAIFTLFVLIRGLATADVKNVSYQGMTPAKVFTNYMKVPWINLNSSWKNKVASLCRDDITTLFESADAGEMWALRMLDAASKIPAGIFNGNIRELGMYEECIRVKSDQNPANIQGQHCMVSLSMPPKFIRDAETTLFLQKLSAYNPTPKIDLNFAPSICLPSSCNVEDIVGLVNASIKATPELNEFEVKIARVTCSGVEATSDNFTLGTILAMSFFAFVGIILLFCTGCDFAVKAKSDNPSPTLKTLAQFSLYTNAIKLWSTKTPPGTMPAIHGFKFFSICLVVMIHRFLSTLAKPLVNLSTVYELRETLLGTFILLSPLAVDTFLVINGFLMAYYFLTRLRSGLKINLAQIYLHRYLRLAPCMIALLLFVIFIIPLIGTGPLWESVLSVTSDYCRKNWWANLLYIQNFVDREEMCMPHTWYSAVEMQLFWISPIILYPLFYRPKLGLVVLSVFLTASLITPAVYLFINQYSFLINVDRTFGVQFKEFVYSYTPTYNRAMPYFVGVLLGYLVANNERKLTKAQVTFNWILALVFAVFCFLNTYFIQPNAIVYNVAWEVVYVSVGRFGWSLAAAWIIYACTQGYGGPLTRFLSLPIFVPLSRMSYGIYLVSAVIQLGVNSMQETAEFATRLEVSFLVMSDLVVSIVAAFVMTLFFESPVVVLEKILRTKETSKITEHPLEGRKKKLVAIIKEYPNFTTARISSNSDIQARMLQPNFWRTVSDILNTSGKRSTKTPTEWVKTWQDWKLNLSKNDSQWKPSTNGIRNGTAELETGITTPEKELLIFLAAVSCSSDDVASFEQADIAQSTKSQSDHNSCCSRNPDCLGLASFNSRRS